MNDISTKILDNLPALITAGLAVITYFNSRKNSKLTNIINAHVKAAMKPLEERLETLQAQLDIVKQDGKATRQELKQNNLETARVDLLQAITHAPHEHRAILEQADYYFVTLGGDAWMSGIFKQWADDEKVDISCILKRAKHLQEHIS